MSTQESAAPVTQKRCPLCPAEKALQPLSNFGRCNARPKDHFTNLYCKSCINKKVTASRRALQEYRRTRRERPRLVLAPTGTRQLRLPVSPEDHVKEAIRRGARTQEQIVKATQLGIDVVGDELARLLLWKREVKIEVNDAGSRSYVLTSNPIPLQEPVPDMPQRRPGQKCYYGEEYLVETDKESNVA